ncbi:MAG: M42 family metallopeptidase, partial [Promethearchaeota archaeon]
MNQIERKLDEKFLKKICDTPSPSGSEQPVQRLIRERLKSIVDKIETDVMGNVISTLNPSGTPRIMLVGHADEVGLQVRYISKEGFLYFNGLGGIDPHLTPGNRVQILTENGKILGVIGKKAIHLQEGDEQDKIIKLKDQFIDIGARSHEEVKMLGIQIGDPIIFDNYYAKLGNNGDIVSRCFDDKAGTFIVTEIMKRLKELTFDGAVFGVTSVQEEVGVRGAHTASYYIHPTVAITYDVDFASDSPVIQN